MNNKTEIKPIKTNKQIKSNEEFINVLLNTLQIVSHHQPEYSLFLTLPNIENRHLNLLLESFRDYCNRFQKEKNQYSFIQNISYLIYYKNQYPKEIPSILTLLNKLLNKCTYQNSPNEDKNYFYNIKTITVEYSMRERFNGIVKRVSFVDKGIEKRIEVPIDMTTERIEVRKIDDCCVIVKMNEKDCEKYKQINLKFEGEEKDMGRIVKDLNHTERRFNLTKVNDNYSLSYSQLIKLDDFTQFEMKMIENSLNEITMDQSNYNKRIPIRSNEERKYILCGEDLDVMLNPSKVLKLFTGKNITFTLSKQPNGSFYQNVLEGRDRENYVLLYYTKNKRDYILKELFNINKESCDNQMKKIEDKRRSDDEMNEIENIRRIKNEICEDRINMRLMNEHKYKTIEKIEFENEPNEIPQHIQIQEIVKTPEKPKIEQQEEQKIQEHKQQKIESKQKPIPKSSVKSRFETPQKDKKKEEINRMRNSDKFQQNSMSLQTNVFKKSIDSVVSNQNNSLQSQQEKSFNLKQKVDEQQRQMVQSKKQLIQNNSIQSQLIRNEEKTSRTIYFVVIVVIIVLIVSLLIHIYTDDSLEVNRTQILRT